MAVRTINILFVLLSLVLITTGSTSAYAQSRVEYEYDTSGLAVELAREALKDKTATFERAFGRKPVMSVARVDLNNDGVPEIIARINEQMGFCDARGCDTYAFVVTRNGLIEIANIKTETLWVLKTATDNIRDLVATQFPRHEQAYLKWEKSRYKLAAY